MYISKLHLQNWRNFRDFRADLRPRVFVIGPNAVGKSNLLDAVRFLRDIAAPGGGLSTAVNSRGGLSLVRCLYARQRPDIEFEVEIADDSGKCQWLYALRIRQDNNRRPKVASEIVRNADGELVISRPTPEDIADDARLIQTALEQVSANRDFRPVAEFFQSVSYQHLVPQVVRDPQSFSSGGGAVVNDPFGRDFLLRVYNTPKNTRRARLKNITAALKAAIPQLAELDPEMDNNGVPHLVGSFMNWRPQAAKQNEAHFSDGTLRLLGLLWSAFEGDGPLLLEEPELSLHPEIVQKIPAMFRAAARARKRPRQVITSTYSREMLDDPGIGADEVLVLRPDKEGTQLAPLEEADKVLLGEGMTVADVLLPKAAPLASGQFIFA